MKTKLMFLCLFVLYAISSFGQNQSIQGKVVSASDNEPIIGASVAVKGTAKGTITGVDGSFSLTASPKATLVISYIGYTTVEVALNGQSSIRVVLKEDTNVLDDV